MSDIDKDDLNFLLKHEFRAMMYKNFEEVESLVINKTQKYLIDLCGETGKTKEAILHHFSTSKQAVFARIKCLVAKGYLIEKTHTGEKGKRITVYYSAI